jgi:cysteine-rich repeat protein
MKEATAVLVALVVSGCGMSRPLRTGGVDASGDVAAPGVSDAGHDDGGGNLPDARLDWRPPFDCPECNGWCGDGVLKLGEQCDDGNKNSGDGCTALCQIAEGWICPVPGMPCQRMRLDRDGGPGD